MAVELYDEHEQAERVRGWIREYGFAIVMGVVLAFAGIFGWRQWGEYRAQQSLLAAEYYAVVQSELDAGRLDAAEEQFHAMADAVGRQAYTGMAMLLMASALVDDGRLQPAADLYSQVLDQRRLRSLWPVATLRLARVRNALGETGAALELLTGDPPPGYAAIWAETRGDLLLDDGRHQEAGEAYERAIELLRADGVGTRLVEIKRDAARSHAARSLS